MSTFVNRLSFICEGFPRASVLGGGPCQKQSFKIKSPTQKSVVGQFEFIDSNLEATIALHSMHYNFCRIHKTLRVTPAIEAGIADHG